MRRFTLPTALLFAPLLLALAVSLAGCDLFGDDGDGVQCFSSDPSATASLEEIPGKVVFGAARVDAEGKEIGAENQSIYVLEDGNVTPLVPDSLSGFNPAWSPDGTQVAFASGHRATTLGPYLYLMNTDGSNLRFLKRTPEASAAAVIGWDPAWSPDGTHIAFSWCLNCEMGGRNYEVSVVKNPTDPTLDAEDFHTLTNDPDHDAGPAWGPDGEKVAFSSLRRDDSPDIYIADATGSGVRQLTETGNINAYAWAPSGDCMLTSLGDARSELFLLDPGDGDTENVQAALPKNRSNLAFGGWPTPDMALLHSVAPSPTASTTLFVISPRTGRIRATAELKGYDVGQTDWFLPPEAR